MRYFVIEGRLDTPGEKHLILSDRSIGEDRNRLSYNISSNDSRYPYQFLYFARFQKTFQATRPLVVILCVMTHLIKASSREPISVEIFLPPTPTHPSIHPSIHQTTLHPPPTPPLRSINYRFYTTTINASPPSAPSSSPSSH